MQKKTFSRMLAALLAVLLLTQTLCITAFAENPVEEVLIPQNSTVEEVNQILTAKLIQNPTGNETWEYECEGTSKLGTPNTAWGSVEGFTSSKKVGFTNVTYTHAALAANTDGQYKVRVAGTTEERTIIKKAKLTSGIELNTGASVALVYGEDGTLDAAATKEAIISAVVKSVKPADAELTVKYYATAKTGVVQKWVPLEGGKVGSLTYPAISAGEQQIQISWDGNDQYYGFEQEITVKMTERESAPYERNDPANSVKLVYNDDLSVDYAQLKTDLFSAVIKSSDVLTAENVTMEYYAADSLNVTHAWVALEGGKSDSVINPVDYPAIPEGNQQIRLTYAGDKTYARTVIEATVEIKGRDALTFDLNEGPYEVPLVFTAAQGYDYDATAKSIYDAVVKGTNPTVDFSEITVAYDASLTGVIANYQPLDNSAFGTKKFGEGTWNIRFSWPGNREVAPGEVVVSVTMTDSRLASSVALKEDVSFTYNKDVAVMKQAILDSVIDWENSDLPDGLSVDDFTFTYYAKAQVFEKDTSIYDYVPFEGDLYEVAGQVLGGYPQIGAGEQQIRVSYNGGADYKPSAETDGTVTIDKASVKVHVKSTSMYVSEAANGLDLVTTDPVDNFDTYVVYAGLTSDVTTALYVQLPARYTSNSTLLAIVDAALKAINKPTLTELMREGTTVGELREILSASDVIAALEKIGVGTGVLGQVIQVIDKLPGIADSVRIAFGSPNHAGIYAVTAVTDNSNYKTGVGVGALVLKADKAKLVWKQDISKISAADAANADFMAELTVDGVAVADQSSVHVLYSGFTSKWKPYSSTTTPPTEPGRYVMTVVVLGGDYVASPVTRTFQITK